jgi:hypothetical protein
MGSRAACARKDVNARSTQSEAPAVGRVPDASDWCHSWRTREHPCQGHRYHMFGIHRASSLRTCTGHIQAEREKMSPANAGVAFSGTL